LGSNSDSVPFANGFDNSGMAWAPHTAAGSSTGADVPHFSLSSIFSDSDDEWGPLQDNDEEDFVDLGVDEEVPSEWCDSEGFIPDVWICDQAALERKLTKFGLIGERLAIQDGEELTLLNQLLQALDLTPGLAQQSYHLQQLRRLTFFAMEDEPRMKRLRGTGSSIALQRLADVCTVEYRKRRAMEVAPLLASTDLALLPLKGKRRQLRKNLMLPGQDRAAKESALRDELVRAVLHLLTKGEVPIIQLAAGSKSAHLTVSGATGATRVSTIQVYLKAFGDFLCFLHTAFGLDWPTSMTHITDYLHAKASQPCCVSAPTVFLQSLSWFERVASIPQPDKFSAADLVKRTVDFVIEKVSVGAPLLKQAPRYPLVMVAALELFVTNEEKPKGLRLKAFSMLLKGYASLREDDLQRCDVDKIRTLGEVVVGVLLRTKTTGKTKRVKELPITLWTGCGFTMDTWIPEGLAILQTFGEPERDFVLPIMSSDFTQPGKDPLTYAGSAALTKRVLKDLRVPTFTQGIWKLSDEPLVHQALLDFWTEHAGRPLMASLLVLLGVDQKTVDFCGRWSPSGSQEYMRTHRSVVSALQQQVCEAVRLGDRRLNDWDVIERLDRFFSDRNVSEPVAKEARLHLESQIARYLSERLKPEQICWAKDMLFESATLVPQLIPTPLQQPPTTAAISAPREALGNQRKAKFLIIYGKNRSFARLHRTDSNCQWTKLVIKDCQELDVVSPECYNARCKTCWPRHSDENESESSLSEG
jgi:hypothetical protein